MATYKGILSFATLFVPKKPKGSEEPKFSSALLFPANDPQVATLLAEVAAAKAATFPNGYTGTDECFGLYEHKITPDKEYHDPRFKGWYLLSSTAKQDDKPAVVDSNRQPIIDGNKACSGAMVYANVGISGYVKGKGGIGGWLNGIMVTDEPMPFGRLDGKPSVEQMFADAGATSASPPASPAPAPAASPAQYVMTAKANGATREAFLSNPAWSDELLIAEGYMLPPVVAAPAAPAPAAPAPAPAAPAPAPAPAAPAPAPAPAAPQYVMTAKANGATREAFLSNPAWSDALLIAEGYMLPPNGVAPSFA